MGHLLLVGDGFIVDVTNPRLGIAFQRLQRSPVHVGRDPKVSTCILDDLTVSRLHVSVTVREGRIEAYDVESAAGTYTPHGRLEGGCWVDLGPCEERQDLRVGEWVIRLDFHPIEGDARLEGVQPPAFVGDAGPTVECISGPKAPRAGSPSLPPAPSPPFVAPPASPAIAASPFPLDVAVEMPAIGFTAEAARLNDAYVDLRAELARLGAALAKEIESRPPSKRARFAESIWIRVPDLGRNTELAALLPRSGSGFAHGADAGRSALVTLQELSRTLGNSETPHTPSELEAFVCAVTTGIRELLAGLLPLLAGVARFEQEMALRTRQATAQQAMNTAEALSRVLFDWQTPSETAVGMLRNGFAGLMTQQIGTLHGVMHGVRALLEELSPSAITAAWEAKRSSVGPLRRAFAFVLRPWELWRVYIERFGDFADEEQARFRIVFGPRFAEEYRNFRSAFRQRSGGVPRRPAGPSGTQVLPKRGDVTPLGGSP